MIARGDKNEKDLILKTKIQSQLLFVFRTGGGILLSCYLTLTLHVEENFVNNQSCGNMWQIYPPVIIFVGELGKQILVLYQSYLLWLTLEPFITTSNGSKLVMFINTSLGCW